MLPKLTMIGMLSITFGRILTGLILVIAGSAKLKAGSGHFQKAILGYDLVPEKVAWVLARWLPWVEVISGGLLAVGFLSQVVAVVATVLLLAFSAAIAFSLWRGRQHDCGCSGKTSEVQQVQWRLIYRNLAFMGILLAVYAFEGGPVALDNGLKLWSIDSAISSIGLLALNLVWIGAVSATVLLHFLTQHQLVRRSSLETPSS